LRRLQATRSLPSALLVGVLVGGLVFHLHRPFPVLGTSLLWRWELLSYDWRLPGNPDIADDIVVVAIDKESSDALQTWPWPRSIHATMIDRLTSAGARAIGLDIVFSETSGSVVPDDWLQEAPPSPDDLELVRALKQSGRVVLAALFVEQPSERDEFETAITSAQFPYWQFEEAAANVGIVNFSRDVDGGVRRMHLSHVFQDEQLPSFALALMRVASGSDAQMGELSDRAPHPYLPHETVLIQYAGPDRTFRTVPFYQALDEKLVSDEVFRGKVVLVGATDPLLQDIHQSPMLSRESKDMAGVEIQANSLATLLSGHTIWPVPMWVVMLLIMLAGLIGAVATALLRPVRALWSTLLPAGALGVILPVVLLRAQMIWVPMVAPLLALAVSYTVVTLLMYVAEERARRAIRAAWQRRVAPEILDMILRSPQLAQVRGRRIVATTLFSDIRGFTSMCDAMKPEQVVEVLNEYLSQMTEVIRSQRGTVHKFIGDGIMAVFGDPMPDERHAEQAVMAAMDMHRKLQEIKQAGTNTWVRELRIGIGIHSGELVAGDIGSTQFMEYTVIGATVSVASRLESMNKQFGTGIIISDATRQLLQGQHQLVDLGLQEIRGIGDPIRIYSVSLNGKADPASAALPGRTN
jgi:adenylate cyclase